MAVRTSRLAVVTTLVALVILAGCSRPAKTLERAGTQRAVSRVITDRVDGAVPTTSCPQDIARGKGRTVTCKVTLKGTEGTARTRVRQLDGDGTLDVSVLDAVVANSRVTAELKAQLKARFGRAFQADCGKGLRIVAPGESFRCRARDASGRRTVTVTVTDPAGTLRFRVLS
ncbi:MAG: DUF4333 domain-containing protein [Acidimicrobiales bacterium]